MYPSRFRYEAPRSLDEAIGLLHAGDGEAKVLAGGQSLVPLLKLRFAAPALLVDINSLPGLGHHREDADGTLRVGALCRHVDLERCAPAGPTAADGRGRATDRRPDRARPRHAGRLALPRRPSGDWAAVVTALAASWSRRARAVDGPSRSPEFSPARSRTPSAYGEIAVEAVLPEACGKPVAGGFLKLERRVGDFATAGDGGLGETSQGDRVVRAGIALTGVGSRTIHAYRGLGLAGRPDADRGRDRPRRRPGRRGGRAELRPPGQHSRTSGTSSTPSSPGS